MHAERPLPDIHGNGGAANDAKDPKREAAKMLASSSANNVSNFYGHLSNFNEADDPILPLSAMSSGAFGIPISHIQMAIKQGNQEIGASVVEMAEAEYMVRATGYIKSVED